MLRPPLNYSLRLIAPTHLKKALLTTHRSFSAPSADHASHFDASATDQTSLVEIPSLPLFGSMLPAYSGIPRLDMKAEFVNYWRKLYKEKGPFFSVGIPGLGSGWNGTVYVVRDPYTMLKVLKKEGAYPSGAVQNEWPTIGWMKKKKYSSIGLFERGAEWKRLRNFLQKDLLAPASAREYLPGILRGAAKASQNAPKFVEDGDINKFFSFAAMDMFTEVLFGGNQRMSEADYHTFCTSAIEGFAGLVDVMWSPVEHVAHWVGIETLSIKRFNACMDVLDEIARRRLEGFLKQIEGDDLTPEEKNSYLFKMISRQQESGVTKEEMIELAVIMMIAGVDTTASKTSWNLLHLSLRPDVQDNLYEQVNRAVQKEGGLTASIFENSEVPLLQALTHESFRCTPPLFADIMKKIAEPMEIHGVTLPAGSTVMFDSLTNMMDPNLVEDPMDFKPELWLKEAVEGRKNTRKNTPAAIIDHTFYSGPFSQGARRCPGSRVANLEEQVLIAQLVLDWKIEGPKDVHWSDVPGKLQMLFIPVFPEEVRFVPRS